MPYSGNTSRSSVKLVMGHKSKPSCGIMMEDERSERARAHRESAAFDMMKSIRQVLQKPDVSHVQLLAWLRNRKKETGDTSQQGREWSRFMRSYIRSNANVNDTVS